MKFSNNSILICKKILLFFLFTSVSFGQQITIRDSETNEVLSDVAVFNESRDKSTISDLNGNVDLGLFSNENKIYFQLLGYSLLELYLDDIEDESIVLLYQESQNLDEVILSVARSASNVNQIAEKVSVIKSEDLFISSPSSGAEMLELSPGVRIQKSQGGGGSPIIRGFEANRVLIVVDGVRMNNAIYRSGHLQLSLIHISEPTRH